MRDTSWVVLEISSAGEEEALAGNLKKRITSSTSFQESDIYIPLLKRTLCDPIWLMEGYFFIKSGYSNSEYYQLKHKRLVKNVISQIDNRTGMISIGVVSDRELKQMVKRIDDLGGSFKPDELVKIKEGPFSGFEGKVILTWMQNDVRMYSLQLSFRSVVILFTIDCLSVEGV
jgi:transcription antitermination factor NusG